MTIDEEIKYHVEKSVLCWLATASTDGQPNVSPKEIFTYHKGKIIIANIASPNSMKNIKDNPKVCVSFVDILSQKGLQIKGVASIDDIESEEFDLLQNMAGARFPVLNIISVSIESSKPILAPSYLFYPDTSEEEQIKNAIKQYRITSAVESKKPH